MDMLNSLEIILENEKTLEFFEKFLKNEPNFLQKDSGYSLLCFYKEITCRLHFSLAKSPQASQINFLQASILSPTGKINENSAEDLKRTKISAFKTLNEKYYQNFLRSEECKELRRIINKEEILTFRIMQTSFIPFSRKQKKNEDVYFDKSY